jgi:hypothetical protein
MIKEILFCLHTSNQDNETRFSDRLGWEVLMDLYQKDFVAISIQVITLEGMTIFTSYLLTLGLKLHLLRHIVLIVS